MLAQTTSLSYTNSTLYPCAFSGKQCRVAGRDQLAGVRVEYVGTTKLSGRDLNEPKWLGQLEGTRRPEGGGTPSRTASATGVSDKLCYCLIPDNGG